MKKANRIIYAALCAVLLLAAVVISGAVMKNAKITADADIPYVSSPYSFYFKNYEVSLDVKSNREIDITEKLTIHYTGRSSTGFYRDIPVNGGEMVKKVSVTEIVNGLETPVVYYVEKFEDDGNNDFISLNIGDTSKKYDETREYHIKYKYCLTKAQEGDNILYINAVGTGRETWNHIEKASVTVILPDGYISGECFKGTLMSETKQPFETLSIGGRKTVKISDVYLGGEEGITFKLQFEEGALSTYREFAPYFFVIAGVVVFLIVIALKLLYFNKTTLTPIVNFEAPGHMDPLLMGKLIDNKVDGDDITSMIFYWAGKGYLKINLENKKDPVIIRTVRYLPADAADYEKLMFERLFESGDAVKPSQLKYKFYKTVENVRAMVNSKTKKLYSGKSIAFSVLFAVIGGILPFIAQFILGLSQISIKFFSFTGILALCPCAIIFCFGEYFKLSFMKYDGKRKLLFAFILALIAVAYCVIYALISPVYIIGGFIPSIFIAAASCLITAASVFLTCRTESYNAKLNEIVGFRNFILLAEKDRLETLIEDDPQFYYHILPYAQVLGVSDKWEEKFKDIAIEPPAWVTSSALETVIEFHIINSLIRSSMSSMTSGMVSRPSSSGSSGFGGFSGGGHVGGGHGGGGFRGR